MGLLYLLIIPLLVGLKLTYGENDNRFPRSVSPGTGITSGELNDTAGDGTFCPCSPVKDTKQGDDGHSSVNEPATEATHFPDNKYLKETGSDSIKRKVSEFTRQTSQGQELFEAFENRDYDLAKALVLKHPELVNYRNGEGMPAIVKAIRSNQKELVKLFLSLGVNPGSKDGNGATLLYHAVDYNSVEIARLLLDNGALTDRSKSEQGSIPGKCSQAPEPLLLIAAGNRNLKMVELLLSRGADINLKDENGCTAFYHAVKYEESPMAYFLIDKGAEVNTKTNDGTTPLHVVRDLKLARYLVDKGLDVNARDDKGNTPLNCMFDGYYDSEAEKFLLTTDLSLLYISKGADVNAKNSYDQTPLHLAACIGNTRLIRLLVSHGARVDVIDFFGKKPVDYALARQEIIPVLILLQAQIFGNRIIRLVFLTALLLGLIFAFKKYFLKNDKPKPE